MTHIKNELAVHQGPVAVRAYVKPGEKRERARRSRDRDELVLVLDCETTVDSSQKLIFGSYRVYRRGKLVQEGLTYPDECDLTDLAILRAYVAEHPAEYGGELRLVSREHFVNEILWHIGYVGRALIVGFNLAFDLSRLAIGQTRSRSRGFSLQLWQSVDREGRVWRHKWRPDVTVKHLGSKRQFISFTTPARLDDHNRVDGYGYRGRFCDLHMAANALTDRSLSLNAAAAEFGIAEGKADAGHRGVVTAEYIDYNRQDVRLTWLLYQELSAEWAAHGLEVPLEELYSGASVGKAYSDAMSIRPPLEKASEISPESLGHHFTAYFGGRTECRIRGVPLPVRYVDVTSMYPTVFSLLGLWSHVVAGKLVEVDATAGARDYLAEINRDGLHAPAAWEALACTVCRIRPAGELLPVRARYGANPGNGAWTIGLNELASDVDHWYTLADLTACKLLTGRVPAILEARRVVPRGTQRGLREVKLAGVLPVEPASVDFFRLVVEERKRLEKDSARPEHERRRLSRFLKVLANSTSYGVFAEIRVGEPVRGGTRVTAYGLDALDARVQTPEEPGRFLFPPLAASITGAARLLLALLEADLAAMGGSYVGCDTDSMLIVASPIGGLVPCPGGQHRTADGQEAVLALSDPQVDAMIAGIDRLNPYARDAVPTLLKLEDENFGLDDSGSRIELRAVQLSSKRYALYQRNGDEILLRKPSEHGFGLYRPPVPREEEAWHHQVWRRFVRELEGVTPGPLPEWLDRPAVSQLAVSTPALLTPFRKLNEGKPYANQVKPFNFLLIGHADPLAPVPEGFQHGEVTAIAPYSAEPDRYLELPWLNRHDGRRLPVTTKPGGRRGSLRLKTYGDAIGEFRAHPEVKSGDPAGGLATRSSRGLLPRLRVIAADVRHIGKESNRLDEVEEGLISDPDEVYVEYRDERREWLSAVNAVREVTGAGALADALRAQGVPDRTIRSYIREGRVPRQSTRIRLSDVVRRIRLLATQADTTATDDSPLSRSGATGKSGTDDATISQE